MENEYNDAIGRKIVWEGLEKGEWSWEDTKLRIVEIVWKDGRKELVLETCNRIDTQGNECWQESRNTYYAILKAVVWQNEGRYHHEERPGAEASPGAQ